VLFTIFCNWKISYDSNPYIFSSSKNIPKQKVGVLLGTSKQLKNGYPNQYFVNRIDAASELFHTGKIEYIIVSGDNSEKNYNEPEDMKNALIEKGVPEDKIILDYAGFRTFDSVIRAKEIFGQTALIIISQKFHNQRAIYIARKNGIEAYGYNAGDVKKYGGLKTKAREYLARTNVFIDQIIGKKPKFLGEKITIE
jgi:SanA protein